MTLRSALFLLLAGLACAQEKPFYFIQLTDPQMGMYTANQGFSQETANLAFAVNAVNRLKPAFVVVTGDLVNKSGDAAQIAEYQRIMRTVDPSIPVYSLPGNHDEGNEPTPESVAAYRKSFGRDYYSFRSGPVYGLVLDSALLHEPKQVAGELEKQEKWLLTELEKAKASGAEHIVVFQHHPYFIKTVDEKDAYENIPQERRKKYLNLFQKYGVRYVFAGHYHQNAAAAYDGIEMVTTGPVGKPLRGARSGFRIIEITGKTLKHQYCEFGDLPANLSAGSAGRP